MNANPAPRAAETHEPSAPALPHPLGGATRTKAEPVESPTGTVPRQGGTPEPHGTPEPAGDTPPGADAEEHRAPQGEIGASAPAEPLDHPDPLDYPDPLDHPDPRAAADAAAVENLLRCWVRENNLPRPAGDTIRIPLPATGTALLAGVRHWSAAGWHRFDAPLLDGAPRSAPAADAVTVAALLAREGTATAIAVGLDSGTEAADLVARVADSVRNTAVFIADRRAPTAARAEYDPFLSAEQCLLLGHPLHPTPKSREGLSEAEARRFAPESQGSFPLHWMAVDRSVLATDTAWTERGRTITADRLTARLAGDGHGDAAGTAAGTGAGGSAGPGVVGALHAPDNTALLPLHPWQARDLHSRPEVAALLDAGLLHDLGAHGTPWHPTSSVRTVYRPGAPAMLKLSLGLRITNSRRENLRKELHRGTEVHRLLRTGLSDRWRAEHPGFDIVRDPAWLAVDDLDGNPVTGLDVVLRHNPFGPGDDAVCIAGLTSPRPWPDAPAMRSRLSRLIAQLATRTGRTTGAVSAEWFLRYLEAVVRPVLWLDGTVGIALEAHQQNTLVLLDPDGWPIGGRYRDNQGYYFRESHRDALEARLPGIGLLSDTFVPDAVTDERFAYYLGINNVLGLIGAFGAQGLADEQLLLAAFRRFLTEAAALGSPLPERLLSTPTLRCKANLLTRLHGLDELVGPVDTQSVYVTIANPLHS